MITINTATQALFSARSTKPAKKKKDAAQPVMKQPWKKTPEQFVQWQLDERNKHHAEAGKALHKLLNLAGELGISQHMVGGRSAGVTLFNFDRQQTRGVVLLFPNKEARNKFYFALYEKGHLAQPGPMVKLPDWAIDHAVRSYRFNKRLVCLVSMDEMQTKNFEQLKQTKRIRNRCQLHALKH